MSYTDGALPKDVYQTPAEGVYTPNMGVVAAQGGNVSSDNAAQPYAPTVVAGKNGAPFVDKAANASPTLADVAEVVALSPNNTGLPVNVPTIVQKAVAKSTGSVASLAATFASNVTAGNSIVVVAGLGNGTDPTIADTGSNTYTKAITGANSTTFEATIFYATTIAGGANTVTVTNAGAAASMAVEIYEVSGLIAPAPLGSTVTNTGTGTTASTSNVSPGTPNALAFAGVAVGTAAQALTAGLGWTFDSGQQNPVTPAGLYSFGSFSQFLPNVGNYSPSVTLAGSEPWAMAVALFRPVVLGIEGTVRIAGYNYTNITTKTTTVVKGGPGVLHSIVINAPGSSDTLTIYDNTAGSNTKIGTITVTAGYPYVYDAAFATGLTIVSGGTTAGDYTVIWK